MKSHEEWVDQALEALAHLDPAGAGGERLLTYLYTADARLSLVIADLLSITRQGRLSSDNRIRAGRLMEQVAYLAFKGLKGVSSIKSFQSAGPQYDLLVTGDEVGWLHVAKMFYMKTERRDILVEAKAIAGPIGDKEFARLSAILDQNLETAGLGVFLTLKGASGFPSEGQRQRVIGASRLRQVLYHAKHGRPIIVLSIDEIAQLGTNGALTTIIVRKVRDIAELSGLPTVAVDRLEEADLPPHLEELSSTSRR